MKDKEKQELVSRHITDAWKWAEAGREELATKSFSLARSIACQLVPKDELDAIIAKDLANHVKERERYRALLHRHVPGSRGLVLIADMLTSREALRLVFTPFKMMRVASIRNILRGEKQDRPIYLVTE